MNSYPSQFPGNGPGMGPGGPMGGAPGSPSGPGMGGLGGSTMVPPADVNSAVKSKKQGKKDKDPKAPTPRTAMNYKIAGAVALIAALLVFFFTSRPDPKTFVARTASDIGALQTVSRSQLEAIQIAPEYVEKDAITASSGEEALNKAVAAIKGPAQYPLAKGQQVRANQFAGAQVLLEDDLLPDERLISISANVATGVAGNVRPGDRVDIIATTKDGEILSNVIAQNIPVVAVTSSQSQVEAAAQRQTGEEKNATASELLPGAPIPGIYVIKVKADQVTDITAVDSGAKIYLAYRGVGATDGAVAPAANANTVISGGTAADGTQAPVEQPAQ